jgi:hypothetical protein
MDSPLMPEFVMIDNATFERAQKIVAANEKGKGANRRPTNHGALMLTGLVYCGACGKKFTSLHTKAERKRKNGKVWKYEKFKYRCGSFRVAKTVQACDQRLYDAKELESLIIADAKNFVLSIDKERILATKQTDSEAQIASAVKRVERMEADIAKKSAEIKKLKDEVMLVIMGQSGFSKGLLTDMLQAKENELTALNNSLDEANETVLAMDAELAAHKTIAAEILTWSDRFDAAGKTDKKTMLINIIDRITVQGDKIEVIYKIKVTSDFNITPQPEPVMERLVASEIVQTDIQSPETAENGQRTASNPVFLHQKEFVQSSRFGAKLPRTRTPISS